MEDTSIFQGIVDFETPSGTAYRAHKKTGGYELYSYSPCCQAYVRIGFVRTDATAPDGIYESWCEQVYDFDDEINWEG